MNERSKARSTTLWMSPACRAGPSAAGTEAQSWNKVRLASRRCCKGGGFFKVWSVTNGRSNPPTSASSGIFHYTDRTEARVRGMTYVGAWSKKLPTAAELFEVRK